MQRILIPGKYVHCHTCRGEKNISYGFLWLKTSVCPTCSGRGFGVVVTRPDPVLPDETISVISYAEDHEAEIKREKELKDRTLSAYLKNRKQNVVKI